MAHSLVLLNFTYQLFSLWTKYWRRRFCSKYVFSFIILDCQLTMSSEENSDSGKEQQATSEYQLHVAKWPVRLGTSGSYAPEQRGRSESVSKRDINVEGGSSSLHLHEFDPAGFFEASKCFAPWEEPGASGIHFRARPRTWLRGFSISSKPAYSYLVIHSI